MARVDRITATLILAFALLASFQSLRMGLWKGGIPGSGLFPLVGAGAIAVLATLLLVTSKNAAPDKKASFCPGAMS